MPFALKFSSKCLDGSGGGSIHANLEALYAGVEADLALRVIGGRGRCCCPDAPLPGRCRASGRCRPVPRHWCDLPVLIPRADSRQVAPSAGAGSHDNGYYQCGGTAPASPS